MTLTPQPGEVSPPPSFCILCGSSAVQDIILNVLLFLPFGIGLRVYGLRRWKAVAIALAISTTIELLQIRIIPGRDASLGDVITNTTGAALGVWLADTWRHWVLPGAYVARRLFLCGAAAWLAIMAATVWGTRTALPSTIYWGQWAPDLLNFDQFPGTLVRADVNGFQFPNGMAGDSPSFRRQLISDTMLVRATVIPGGATQRVAPIVSVFDQNRTEIFLLGQRGRDAVFSLRMNAEAAGLAQPAIRLPNAFPAEPTAARDTVRLAAGVVGRQLVLRAESNGTLRERRMPLGPGLGWSFLIPFHYAYGPESPLLTALWLGGLALVLGYWAARSRGPAEPLVLAFTIALGLAATPPLLGGHAAPWWAWVGAIVGAMLGWAVGKAAGFRRQEAGFRRREGTLLRAPTGKPLHVEPSR
jgi:hypothetical protein